MPLSDLTREGVLRTIAECQRVGREVFLDEHGYKPAKIYVLLDEDDREYDSKAIAGVACGMTPDEFSGGAQTVERALADCGFTVIHADTHWYEDELMLVLHWYLRDRHRTFLPGDPDVSLLCDALQRLASVRGRVVTGQRRQPQDVVAQLERFREVDPDADGHGAANPSPPHQRAWDKHATKLYVRKPAVQALLQQLSTAADARDAPSYGQRNRPAKPEPTLSPEAMRAPYRGPRTPAPRTAAAPRAEDPAAWDRANECHEQLRDCLAKWLVDNGFTIYEASTEARNHAVDYDLGAHRDQLRLLIETKSMPAPGSTKAETGRLRHGLGQVLWYRRRLQTVCREQRVAVLAVEREPVQHEAWIDLCRDLGVVLVWPDRLTMLIDDCIEISRSP